MATFSHLLANMLLYRRNVSSPIGATVADLPQV